MAEGFECNEFKYPLEPGALVINEFVASSDSLGGIQEPDGGTPDWIELYNNTNEDIIVNHHFYLSDDVDFPKKWNFRTPINIPAKGYQIVWADRDVHQQDIHCNFKLEKSSGDLILVYEDLTIIDQVSYEEQELNKAYARIPNGTGAFVIQNHTFKGNNNAGTTTANLIGDESISIHPNPIQEYINIYAKESLVRKRIFSMSGQLLIDQSNDNPFIDVPNLLPGIYFLHLQTHREHKIFKIIKA